MLFQHVRLQAPAHRLDSISEFYDDVRTGETELEFVPGDDEPFYHFALLVPGDRFEAALAWAADRAELLPDRETGEPVFDFDVWAAKACYFHDPAGNIVELIAHRGIGESGTEGPFEGRELLGFSELGLVGDTPAMARVLDEMLGLELWDGTVEEEERLAFVGEAGRTLILSPRGRGWLPTGRPAEPHPVEAVLAGTRAGEAELEGGLYRLRSSG